MERIHAIYWPGGGMGQKTTAYHLLEGLNELGIDCIFANFGTDYAPIIEEMAQWQQANKPYPHVILCPHENVAIHMAGGYAMANRGQRVIHLIGDGSFYFSTPTAVYAVAQQEQLPIFTVVFDNGGWQAVKDCTLKVYPEGAAKAMDDFQAHIHRHPHLEKVGEAFGAHGEWVDDPGALPAAIERCLAAIAEGKAAILVAAVQPF